MSMNLLADGWVIYHMAGASPSWRSLGGGLLKQCASATAGDFTSYPPVIRHHLPPFYATLVGDRAADTEVYASMVNLIEAQVGARR